MSATTLHPLAAAYLQRLREAARVLPRTERRDLLMEIEAHLQEATTIGASESEVLEVLDRLGDPQEIVDANMTDLRAAPGDVPGSARAGAHEYIAIVLLLVGGFFVGIGWVVGLVLLWSSSVWSTREKWLGTLVIPGGLAIPAAPALIALTATAKRCTSVNPGSFAAHCTTVSGPGLAVPVIVLLALLVLAALAAAAYLIRKAR
jgi:uncharacterized membrane protein